MQNVDLRLPPHVEDPEQVVLVRDVIRAADLVRRHVEREELAKHGRLDFQHSLGVIGIVERQDVEPQPVTDGLGDPLDFQRQVIPSRFLEPVALQVEDKLLSQFSKSAVNSLLLGEVDPQTPPRQPRLPRRRRACDIESRSHQASCIALGCLKLLDSLCHLAWK